MAGLRESASCTMASSAPTRVSTPVASTRTISRAPRFVAPAFTASPSRTAIGSGLARQHRVVERRAAREHDAIDGDQFAGADLHPVARRQRGQRHLDDGRVGAGPGELPRELEEGRAAQAVGALEGRPLGASLDLPGAEQGRDEHRERVEPDRPAAADDVPRLAAKVTANAIATGRSMWTTPALSPASAVWKNGRAEKRSTGTADDEREPAEERLVRRGHPGVLARVERPVEEHEVHRAGRRHAQAGQRGAILDAAGLLGAGRPVQVRRVPEAVEGAGDGGEARLAGTTR